MNKNYFEENGFKKHDLKDKTGKVTRFFYEKRGEQYTDQLDFFKTKSNGWEFAASRTDKENDHYVTLMCGEEVLTEALKLIHELNNK